MAESRSTRCAAPADSQDRPDPGNKKTRSPVCLKIILLQRGEFFYTSFTARTGPLKHGTEADGDYVEKLFEVRVCVTVCEFGELSADAGSLGHLASAKEKGKLLQWCGAGREGGESKL